MPTWNWPQPMGANQQQGQPTGVRNWPQPYVQQEDQGGQANAVGDPRRYMSMGGEPGQPQTNMPQQGANTAPPAWQAAYRQAMANPYRQAMPQRGMPTPGMSTPGMAGQGWPQLQQLSRMVGSGPVSYATPAQQAMMQQTSAGTGGGMQEATGYGALPAATGPSSYATPEQRALMQQAMAARPMPGFSEANGTYGQSQLSGLAGSGPVSYATDEQRAMVNSAMRGAGTNMPNAWGQAASGNANTSTPAYSWGQQYAQRPTSQNAWGQQSSGNAENATPAASWNPQQPQRQWGND